MIDIEKLRETFEPVGYKFSPKTPCSPDQFMKTILGSDGISYCLTWYVTEWKHEVYGDKITYHCMLITGSRIHITIDDDILDIPKTEKIASSLFKTNLLLPFQKF